MEQIKKSVSNIRKECDNIDEEIEPKKVKTAGDPVVEIY